MGHPLLNTKGKVSNDFEVRKLHDLYIVTGANMAGKSTFLRSLNLLEVPTAGSIKVDGVEITGKNGVRRVPIKDFYLKAGTVDLRAEDGEIQTAILIPKASYDRTFGHYIKYAMRNAMDIATLGTSVNARLSPDKKTFERVRIAFGVAGPVPLRALNAEAFINGRAVTLENIEQFGRTVLEDIHPRDSWRASRAFRSHIAVESAKRCLIESVKLAGGEL